MGCDRCGQDARMYIRFDELELCDFCYYENAKPEEETKVDELTKSTEVKVYTGKEAVGMLMYGKTLESVGSGYHYKFEDGKFYSSCSNGIFKVSHMSLANVFELEFTEVATPQVGDWVKVTDEEDTYNYIGKITKAEGDLIKAVWNNYEVETYCDLSIKGCIWETLSPEQIAEYKREQVFTKVGRKLNEYRENDIVFLENTGTICMVTTKSNAKNVGVKEINKPQKWHAPVKQLTPIAFAENLIAFS